MKKINKQIKESAIKLSSSILRNSMHFEIQKITRMHIEESKKLYKRNNSYKTVKEETKLC